MDVNLAQADVPGIPVFLKTDAAELATFCNLCLRERPAHVVEFHQYGPTNASQIRETLKRIHERDLNLEEFNVCTPCWKLLQLLDEFRVCCTMAADWLEQHGVGLKREVFDDDDDEEWFSEGTARAIDGVWATVHSQVEKLTPEDRIESEVFIGEVKVEPGDIEHAEPQEVEETPTEDGPEAVLVVFKCSRCGICFDVKSGLHIHMRRCRATEKLAKMHTCKLCGATFSKNVLLKAHTNRHKGKKPFPCRVHCDESFYSPTQRYTHESLCRGKQEACPMCGTSFENKQFLNDHLEAVHGVTMYQCESCDRKFANRGDLSRHQILKHGAIPNAPPIEETDQGAFSEATGSSETQPIVLEVLKCDRCKRGFDNQQGLKKHQLRCDGVETNYSYTCQICSISFKFRYMLDDHLNKHEGTTPYQCRKGCGKSFHRTSNRSIHEMQCGTGEYICKICGAKLGGKRSLTEHKRNIHAVTRFSCETCGANFKRKKDLLRHSTLHAEIERKWSCKVCDKLFMTEYAAKEHLNRCATREKVYRCAFCPESFLCKAPYRRHVKVCASGGVGGGGAIKEEVV